VSWIASRTFAVTSSEIMASLNACGIDALLLHEAQHRALVDHAPALGVNGVEERRVQLLE
jgi:hypothetical protein